jgi:hypothetical protein
MGKLLRGPRAVLGFDTTIMLALLEGSKNVYNRMNSQPTLFSAPPITMAVLLVLITNLDGVQSTVKGGPKGSATARNSKAKALITALKVLLAYVDSLVAAAPEADGPSIIEAAGMKVGAVGTHPKPLLELKTVQPSGTIAAFANVGMLVMAAAGKPSTKKRTFSWDLTLDNGETFVRQNPTPLGDTTITGLTPGAEAGVRVALTLGRQPMGEWSQVVYIKAK